MRRRTSKAAHPQGKRGFVGRLSALVSMVVLFFVVLLISNVLGGATLYFLVKNGVVALGERNIGVLLLFLLLVSLSIGTIVSAFGGARFLKPLRTLVNATNEVAAGNFSVKVEEDGPYEMQRLAQSFNRMAQGLYSTETLRNDFVSNISHEFKTPVASIRGFARLLKRDTLTNEQRDEYLDIILFETERLSELSSNVLLLSKLENTESLPEKEPFSLDEQLRRSVLLFEPQLQAKGIALEMEVMPITICANEDMLKHVWINLINNAVKFTPEGGKITVTAVEKEAAAAVTVADTGIGMNEDVLLHVFDKFYQGDSSRATQGNGLGLSLVRRILALSGGEISMRSREGEGSAFTVTLPKGEGC
ncbi:HAMP domain-containing histidine kinase [Christensenellaceae bacterium OttesenSCG-928-M15]|nr:HAMP domain-containing histidine kinase [Christensenellaceae bacterium OttesenSCG-928-M15]